MKRCLWIFTVTALAASPAWAQELRFGSSPNPLGSGARALGKGSAFIAVADDATAASWNPAGLIALEEPEVSFVGAFKSRVETFEGRVAEGEEEQTTNVSDLNYFSAAVPFKIGHRYFVAAINYQDLVDFDKKIHVPLITTGGPLVQEAVTQYKESGSLRSISPALAFQLAPNVAFGLTLNIFSSKLGFKNGFTRRSKVSIERSLNGVARPGCEIDNKYSFDFDGLGANAGLLWDVDSKWTVGAVVKTPTWGNMKRSVDRFESTCSVTTSLQEAFNERYRLPPAYGLGIAYRHSDEFTVSVDAYRIEWGSARHVEADPESGTRETHNPISGADPDAFEVKGITQAHLGLEYLFILQRTVIPLRAGAFYDPEPGADLTNHFVGVALGSGISIGDFVLDAAYQMRTSVSGDFSGVTADNENATTPIKPPTASITQHQFYLSGIYHF
jgi:long-subunit fatty acid transport protein